MNDESETEELLFRALGDAAVKLWSSLPKSVQQLLFEEAVKSYGDEKRHQLAVYLHDKHSRTSDAIKAHAITEPDSLGG